MDNKFYKNQSKIVSSSYPPRSSSDEMGFGLWSKSGQKEGNRIEKPGDIRRAA